LVVLAAVLVFLGAVAFMLLSRPPELAAQLTPVPVSSAAASASPPASSTSRS
jgi:hypothetical protein